MGKAHELLFFRAAFFVRKARQFFEMFDSD